jgi:hypothetical protein
MKFKWLIIVSIFCLVFNLNAQSGFGLDIPMYMNKSLVLIPDAFDPIEGDGGNGFDLGLGVYFQIHEKFKLKTGIHLWNANFNPNFNDDVYIDGHYVQMRLDEQGKISYKGIYINGLYESEIGYIGGGIDFSLSNSYKCDIALYDTNNSLVAKENGSKESFLTDEFNNQFNLLFIMGLKLKVNEKITIVPTGQISIPLMSVFDTDVDVYDPMTDSTDEAKISAVLFKYGINIEFNFRQLK